MKVGDYLMSEKYFEDEKVIIHNELIVFVYPRDGVTKYVKRCVGLPGDTIFIKDKILYVNNVQEDILSTIKYVDTTSSGEQNIHSRKEGRANSRDQFGPYVVPAECYFMLGDNRDNSYDSRYWGVVPDSLLYARAFMIHWSSDWSRIGMKLE